IEQENFFAKRQPYQTKNDKKCVFFKQKSHKNASFLPPPKLRMSAQSIFIGLLYYTCMLRSDSMSPFVSSGPKTAWVRMPVSTTTASLPPSLRASPTYSISEIRMLVSSVRRLMPYALVMPLRVMSTEVEPPAASENSGKRLANESRRRLRFSPVGSHCFFASSGACCPRPEKTISARCKKT